MRGIGNLRIFVPVSKCELGSFPLFLAGYWAKKSAPCRILRLGAGTTISKLYYMVTWPFLLLAHSALSVCVATPFAKCKTEEIDVYFPPPSVSVPTTSSLSRGFILWFLYTPRQKWVQGVSGRNTACRMQPMESLGDKSGFFLEEETCLHAET